MANLKLCFIHVFTAPTFDFTARDVILKRVTKTTDGLQFWKAELDIKVCVIIFDRRKVIIF